MIIFVHVPGFYAAVEAADRAGEPGRPIIVGGDPRKGGTVTSASPEARAFGVVEGMDLREAQARCPEADLRPTRLRRYREVAAELRAILRSASASIESVGLEGAYLQPPPGSDPVSVAAELCVRIHGEVGLRAVAGIGPIRFVAHLAARHAGPEGIRQIPPERVPGFLAPFPVSEIWGLGPATEEKLAEHGLATIGELRGVPLEKLEAIVGRAAGAFLALARAEDRAPLRPSPPVKSLSRETTLAAPSGDLRTLGEDISGLAARVEEMLTRERRAARTVSLGVHYIDGEASTRTQTVPEPLSRQGEIAEVALQLLARTQAGVRKIRRLRLQVTNLCRPESEAQPRQLRLF